jgi:hypothetical protein
MTDNDARIASLVENIHRKNLDNNEKKSVIELNLQGCRLHEHDTG